MENSDDHQQQHNCSTSNIQDDQEGFLCKLENVQIINNNINNDNNNNNDDDHMINGDDDGFKTPTGREHRIPVNLTTPPPAPIKLKAKPMKRRRLSSRRPEFYQQLSFQDLESLFPPHHHVNKNKRLAVNIFSAANINNDDDDSKADNNKFAPLVTSFR